MTSRAEQQVIRDTHYVVLEAALRSYERADALLRSMGEAASLGSGTKESMQPQEAPEGLRPKKEDFEVDESTPKSNGHRALFFFGGEHLAARMEAYNKYYTPFGFTWAWLARRAGVSPATVSSRAAKGLCLRAWWYESIVSALDDMDTHGYVPDRRPVRSNGRTTCVVGANNGVINNR